MKTGFWTAMVLGAIGLVDMLFSPVIGFVQAVVFFAAAWGIRRGRPWAAVAAMALVIGPVTGLLLQAAGRVWPPGFGELAVACLLLVTAAVLLARTAIVLFRRRGTGFLAGSDWVAAVFVVTVFAACLSLRPFMMPTASMANTLLPGDHLLVDVASPAFGWSPRHGDVVLFRSPADPKQTFVKRVVGLPGDRIRMRDKQVFRNGAPVSEPWVIHLTSYTDPYRDNFPDGAPPLKPYPGGETMLARDVRGGEVVVPPGQLFVLGDNRDKSLDSRYFGLVPRGNVIARPLLIYGSSLPKGEEAPSGRAPEKTRFGWRLRLL